VATVGLEILDASKPLEEARFGTSEKALAAPRTLLKWLIEHPALLARRGDPARDSRDRVALLAGDESARMVALGALDGIRYHYRHRVDCRFGIRCSGI
jgi:hypothetical protein